MRFHAHAMLAAGLLVSLPATAQQAKPAAGQVAYPTKAIRLIVPAAPGGGTDIIGRLIGQGLTDSWGQTVVIDNRGGAGGIAGVTIAAKQSAPDGYTMLLGSVGHLTFAPAIERNLAFDPQKDLAPISMAAVQPFVVAVTNSLPAKSIKDLAALAKAKPGAIRYGSGGSGSASHLSVELMMINGGFSLQHIPYKGSNPAITAVMQGEIEVAFAGLQTVLPHAKGGKLRALAVTGGKRAAFAPELPTIAESGVPGYEIAPWGGILAPAGIPKAVLQRLNAEFNTALKSKVVQETYAAAGVEPQGGTPEQFTEHVRNETAKWGALIKRLGIKGA